MWYEILDAVTPNSAAIAFNIGQKTVIGVIDDYVVSFFNRVLCYFPMQNIGVIDYQ